MDKQKGKNEALFTSKLDKGEEIIWLGQSKRETRKVIMTSLLTTILFSLLLVIYADIIRAMGCGARCSSIYPALGSIVCLLLPMKLLALRRGLVERNNFYAISKKRFFIYEDNSLNSYSLHRFTNIVMETPKGRLVDISLYSESGKEDRPIFQLKWLANKEAQNAYSILLEAWDYAERVRERDIALEKQKRWTE